MVNTVWSISASSPVGASELLGQTPSIYMVNIVFYGKPIILRSVYPRPGQVKFTDLFMDSARPFAPGVRRSLGHVLGQTRMRVGAKPP